ncbi:BTAD domain-containing putative transcriptional regulator [Streptomyces sp. NBRC 110028]|uniref:AfsR/SARP family transcriptional regulator n=1 Tax=Streptomyces sp. NBRC 110028 TaxID=1621260 RepID=UPI0006E4532C|nr:BTAD domain-containing putative transcriptional regulator [Streptomyces sp. NBRC 110028]
MKLLALGPLELWHHERRCALGSIKERCVLAVLVHARGEPVTADTLMERVWDGEPPPTGLDTLQSYLSRLRRRLSEAVGDRAGVERPSPRLYRLRVNPEDTDLLRFQRLRGDAGAAAARGERERAVGLLRAAEELWRGEPLAEFTGAWAAAARARLVEDHRRVREERIRLQLELGQHADLVGELRELAAQNPYAQKAIASLMLALYRSGRDDEALTVYRDTRRRLREGQGIEPGADLRELHQRILDQDRALMGIDRPAASLAEAPAVREPGNTLPRDVRDFTGRTSELRILLTPSAAPATSLPLTVIHGMPGVGKTALAIRAANGLCGAYPAGQFYVDLHAYGGQQPCDPAEALAVLLHASGAPGPLPHSLDERAARWRAWTARHRVLVILDNARDAAQVGPLLPGSPGCRAIVTSRNRLVGLNGAASLHLDVLSEAEAVALFARIAGPARLSPSPSAADAEALRRVVAACGCHPLAVQLLASRFRHRDAWGLHDLLDRLAEATDPLEEFDPAVASAFQLSYAGLSAPAQRLFRRLALHPGPDITLAAATALAGPDAARIRRVVEELQDSNLLDEPVRDRYRFHDLGRAFGLQICAREESEAARHEAVERLLGYYLTAAHRADRLVHPQRRPRPPGPPQESPYAPAFTDADEASVWLTLERANLLAAARTAPGRSPSYAALFPHVLAGALKTWGTWDIAAELYGAALTVLRARADRPALARTLVERAEVLAQKRHDEAQRCATEALILFRGLRDPHGCADALLQSGRAHLAAGHGEMALRVLDRAIGRYQQVGDRGGEADCLNIQAAALHYAGRYAEALERVRVMLSVHEALGNLRGQAKALNNLGEIAYIQARYDEARAHYERSRTLARQFGGRQELAILDTNLGRVHQATGDTARALRCFRRALDSHRAAGDTLGEANVLISMGTAYAESGRTDEALRHFAQADRAARSIDNAYERQRALIGTADAHHRSGHLATATEVYRQALDLAQGIGFPLGCAHALAGLTRTALSAADRESAHHYGAQAVDLYQRLDAGAEAERLRCLLAGR